MGEHLSPLAVAHLLQHTLRSLCIHEDSQWVYAVFWRILPRNYPPPNRWDPQGGALDRSRGNRRNWILVWEDGFCNFAASASNCAGSSGGYGSCDSQHIKGLLPEIFFKMSHEIYSYGEGLIGKVAADHGHKWVFREPQDHEVNLPSSWHNPADSHPRTWESQFQCGIKTIALIAVREGVVQLGAVNKVAEDLSYVVLLRKKFNYLESIPGVLLPHPSSPAFPFKVDGCYATENSAGFNVGASAPTVPMEFYSQLNQQMRITPSMSSLEALLSKLPPVGPGPPASSPPLCYLGASLHLSPPPPRPADAMGFDGTAKEEIDDEYGASERSMEVGGQSSSSMSGWYTHTTKPSEEF